MRKKKSIRYSKEKKRFIGKSFKSWCTLSHTRHKQISSVIAHSNPYVAYNHFSSSCYLMYMFQKILNFFAKICEKITSFCWIVVLEKMKDEWIEKYRRFFIYHFIYKKKETNAKFMIKSFTTFTEKMSLVTI